MKGRRVVGLLMTIAIAGCATMNRTSGPERRLERGLAALERGEYNAAFEDLVWLVTNRPNEEEGRQALLALAALDLDPRNPTRRLNVGAQLAARYLRQDDVPAAQRPVVETLYLLAVELGAAEERAAQAEADAAQARRRPGTVPRYSGQPVSARLDALTEERERLRRRIAQLEKDLADRDAELQRIRKTIKP